MQNKKLTAEDCKNIGLPLSEKDFQKIDSLSTQELNKLPKELGKAYSDYQGKLAKEQGMLDWD